jgi:transposase
LLDICRVIFAVDVGEVVVAIPYSVDLRERIVMACSRYRKEVVAEIFSVSLRTVHRILERKNISGSVAPRMGYQKGHSHKLPDLDPLKKLIETNPCSTQKELAGILGVSMSTVQRGLVKLGVTKKRERLNILKGMSKKEKPFKKS